MASASIRELFEQANALAVAQRAAFLDQHCPDLSARATVEKLLLAADSLEASPVLERDPGEWSRAIGESQRLNADAIGCVVGPFVIEAALGEGGSARVFRATRKVEGVVQTVALKVLRLSLANEHARAQFDRERHALVRLVHPNIAQFIDGGVSVLGDAWIALEYVDGVELLEYARAAQLPLRQRIQLMIGVAQAVAAAHRCLIVHRDLKPGNVLVTRQGEVKLLDFGIAKMLSADNDQPHTQTQFRAFTPAYAAPEQRSGGVITTATDVYALGVLLGELVSFERPRSRDATPAMAVTAITESSATTALLARGLKGDLVNILRKATAIAPEERYEGAAALAQDLARLLAGEPVLAHPPSGWYRMRKFVGRHRGGATVVGALSLGIFISLLLALWQARLAHAQAQRAIEVQQFVEALFEPAQAGGAQSEAPTIAQLIQRGVERVEAREINNPMLRADLLAMFARINLAMGEIQRNRALAQAAAEANVLAYGALDPRSIDARIVHASALRHLTEYDAALAVLEPLREELRAADVHGFDPARVLDAISMVRMAQGISGDEAIKLKLEMLAERERDPALTEVERATGYNNVGAAYQYAGDFDAALIWYNKALVINRLERATSRATAVSLLNIGMLQGYQGRFRAAAATLEQGREVFARIPLPRHPSLVSVLAQLCAAYAELEDFERADQRCNEAVALAREVHGEAHFALLFAFSRRAQFAVGLGRSAAANADLVSAQQANARQKGDRHYGQAVIDATSLRAHYLAGDFKQLRESALRLLQGTRARGLSPIDLMASAYLLLACTREPNAACSASRSQAEIIALSNTPMFVAGVRRLDALMILGQLNLEQGDPEAVIALLATVPAQLVAQLGPLHSRVAQAHWLLAAAHAANGDGLVAEQHRAKVRSIVDQLPLTHPLRQLLATR